MSASSVPEPIQKAPGLVEKRIRPPMGISPKDWAQIIELGVEIYRERKEITLDELKSRSTGRVTGKALRLLEYRHNWDAAVGAFAARGVVPLGRGLSVEQSLLITVLTNPADGSSLETKLKKAGVTKTEYNEWLYNDAFAAQLAEKAERNLNTAAPAVTMALVQRAVRGDLPSIQYFDKRAGRDPDKRESVDGAKIVQIVIDALSKHLSKDHPDLLRSIAADIEVGIKFDGHINQ